MILGITEDFTSDVNLDSQLKALPSSGLYLNSGVHPSITVENLLSFLPLLESSFDIWSNGKTYGVYEVSRDKSDIVFTNNGIYQSIKAGTGNTPSESPEYWLLTNLESLRIKSLIEKVKDKVLMDLHLTKRLINNQFIYENGDTARQLPNDYAAWVFEAKGSDYTTIRINEMSLQKDSTDPVNVYIVNQGSIVDTLQLTPDNGRLNFQSLDYTLAGKGAFYVAIDSTEVNVGNGLVDPLKYDGIVMYTATGTGDAPETAKYSYSTAGNGMGFNVTAYLDASKYIDNNLREFGNFIRATFELMVFQTFLHNPNNRSNRIESIQMKEEILIAELKNMQADTVISRYYKEKERAQGFLKKTFDTQLYESDELEIETGSV